MILAPKIIPNFISKKDADIFIDYINTNIDKIEKETPDNNVYLQRFGLDNHNHLKKSTIMSEFNHEIKDLVIYYADKFTEECKKVFSDEKIYPSQFWLVKRYPNEPQPMHTDVDGGCNYQLKYSGVIYLNTLINSGRLMFPHIPFYYSPKIGDLVVFPSDGERFRHGVGINKEDRYVAPVWATNDENFKLY